MIENLFPHVDWAKMWEATLETLYMTAMSTVFTFVIGLALGVLLFLSGPGQLWANKLISTLAGAFVNLFRSIPFIILIILLIPFTKFLLGTIR
ncbi:ABC transporter permease, partial [Microvirga sp. 3-52]|nr:ABC transporter permease [Microvirga sp. 3-52]